MPAHQRTHPSPFGKAGFSQYPLLLAMTGILYSAASSTQVPPSVTDPREATEIDAVRVSASRIDRSDFVSPTPILPISVEELQLDMRTNVGAALNDLPQFCATSSPQTTGSNTGAGNAPVDLRGLGISRTLVLLDDRRVSSSNDLNTVPSVLVKYVDVVTGGASAVWGQARSAVWSISPWTMILPG